MMLIAAPATIQSADARSARRMEWWRKPSPETPIGRGRRSLRDFLVVGLVVGDRLRRAAGAVVDAAAGEPGRGVGPRVDGVHGGNVPVEVAAVHREAGVAEGEGVV